MSDPREPYEPNPPGWTDPYADLADLTGDEPMPRLEDPSVPPAQPPASPLLTGLIIGLLLIALSVAVFQLLGKDATDEATAPGTATTAPGVTAPGDATSTTGGTGSSTSTPGTTVTTLPSTPYPPIEPAIPVDRLKLMSNGIRVNKNDVKDFVFGTPAGDVIGRLTASFGSPSEDTGWQVSTGRWGVCEGDQERIIRFGPFHAIITQPGGKDTFNGYRQDITVGDLDSPAKDFETLSGLKAGDTIKQLEEIYANQDVTYSTDPLLGDIFELRSKQSSELLLWGPVRGISEDDQVLGIFAPDVCDR